MRGWLALVLCASVLAAPGFARADDDDLPEALTVAGVTVLATTYGLTGLTTTTLVIVANRREETIAFSWIPVAGPWIMLGDSAGFNSLQLFAAAASGVLQAAGVGMLIAGLVISMERYGGIQSRDGPRLIPMLSSNQAGLALTGRF